MTERVLLITGASSGIGAATARMASERNIRLALAARSRDKLAELCEELGGPDKALAIEADVTDADSQKVMVEMALDHFGRLDIVFANAGIGSNPGGFSGADPEHWRQMILTNVWGVAVTLRYCLAAIKQSKGHVILTGSRAGRYIIPGSVYGASKWAVTGIAYNLRAELQGTGVRVTLLEPGLTDTPFFAEAKPMGLKAEDIARAVMYAIDQPPSVDVHELMVLPTDV